MGKCGGAGGGGREEIRADAELEDDRMSELC